jgi:hypothetical protein
MRSFANSFPYTFPIDFTGTDLKTTQESANRIPCPKIELSITGGVSLLFDGVDDYVNIPHNANQLLTGGGTIEAWIKPDTLGENSAGFIIDKSTGTNAHNGYCLRMGGTNQVVVSINSGTLKYSATNSVVVGDGNWYHVVATWDSSGYVTIYVNGVQSGTPGVSAAASGITTTNDMRIANRSTATDRTFEGNIKMARIYSRVMGADEIAANFALWHQGCPDPSDSTGLVGYWKLNENTGVTAVDSAPAGNDGTISGAAWDTTSSDEEHTYDDDIISYQHSETDDSHISDILLDNASGELTALELKGFTAKLYHGFKSSTDGRPIYSLCAPQVVTEKKCISMRGKLLCRLQLTGLPDYLRSQKAKLRYEHNATSTKTVKDLLTEIMDGNPVSESLYEQQTTANANNAAYGTCAGGGQHLIIDARTVTALAFKLKKVGSPTGNITFHIARYDDSDGSFTDEATVVWGNASSLTTSSAWCEATLASSYTTLSDDDIVIWWDHFTGDSSNYVSGAYNDFDIKTGEHYSNILPSGTNYFDFISDQDCAYKYKYTYAGISVFEGKPAYEVVYDSEDSLIDSYCPAESFTIDENEDRLSVIDRLLWYTGCQRRFENDGKLHVFVPTTTGTTYDSEYTLAAGHKFFDKSVQNGLVSPNEYVVRSLLTQSTSYSGSATSAISNGRYPVTDYLRIAATSDAQCTAMAEALISHQELAAQQGGATVPVNVCQELYDYIKITDARAGDTKTGNIGALTVYYDSGYFGNARYDMTFQFGKPAVKSVPGAVASAARSIRFNRPPDDPYVKWTADLSLWMEYVSTGLEQLLLWSGIKKAETPTETLIAESLIGYSYQPKIRCIQNVVTASRAKATVYQNGMDTILVAVRLALAATDDIVAYVELGDTSPDVVVAEASSQSADYVTLFFAVPPYAYYEITGGGTIGTWVEWTLLL